MSHWVCLFPFVMSLGACSREGLSLGVDMLDCGAAKLIHSGALKLIHPEVQL
jgi:hypothetical protein